MNSQTFTNANPPYEDPPHDDSDIEDNSPHTIQMKFIESSNVIDYDFFVRPRLHTDTGFYNFNEKIKLTVIIPQSFPITKWDWIGLYKIEKSHKYYSKYIWVSEYIKDSQIDVEFTSPSEIGGDFHFRYYTYRDNEYQNISESDLIWIGAKYILKSSNIKSNSVDLEISRIKGNKSESWSWVGLYQMGETNPHKYINWKYLSENKIITFPLPSCSTWHFKFFPTKRRSSTPVTATICNYSFCIANSPLPPDIEQPYFDLELLKIKMLIPVLCKFYDTLTSTMSIDDVNDHMATFNPTINNIAHYLQEENKQVLEILWDTIKNNDDEIYLTPEHYKNLSVIESQILVTDKYNIYRDFVTLATIYIQKKFESNMLEKDGIDSIESFITAYISQPTMSPIIEESRKSSGQVMGFLLNMPIFTQGIAKMLQQTIEIVCGGKVDKNLFINNYLKIKSNSGNTPSGIALKKIQSFYIELIMRGINTEEKIYFELEKFVYELFNT